MTKTLFGGDLKVHAFSHPIPSSAVIEGRVVGPKGKGLAGRDIGLLVDTEPGLQGRWVCRTNEAGYYRSQVRMWVGKDSRVHLDLVNPKESEKAYRLGTVVSLKNDAVGWYEMPLHIVGQRIDPDFSRNIGVGQKRSYEGRVVDYQGRPLEGACVSLFYKSFWYRRVVTDFGGRWTLPMSPEHLPSRLRLKHPAYIDHRELSDPELREIMEGDGALTMTRGVHFTCVVSNEQGMRLPKARVKLDKPRTTPWGQQPTKIKDAGVFQFCGALPGQAWLEVNAKGYLPARRPLDIASGMAPIEITLSSGRSYCGRVVDGQGQPLEGVTVQVSSCINGSKTSLVDCETVTQSGGAFVISGLPEQGWFVLACKRKQVDEPIVGFELRDLNDKAPFVLPRAPVFRGRIIDAHTGKPVKSFKLHSGHKYHRRTSPKWDMERYTRMSSVGGRFEYKWCLRSIRYKLGLRCLVQVSADGYLPAILGPARLGQDPGPVVVRLERKRNRDRAPGQLTRKKEIMLPSTNRPVRSISNSLGMKLNYRFKNIGTGFRVVREADCEPE